MAVSSLRPGPARPGLVWYGLVWSYPFKGRLLFAFALSGWLAKGILLMLRLLNKSRRRFYKSKRANQTTKTEKFATTATQDTKRTSV